MRKFIVLFFFLVVSVYSKDLILSKEKIDDINFLEIKNKTDTKKLNLDTINPINLSYIHNNDGTNDVENFIVNIDQPIFKSGGIYNAIKYNNSNGKYLNVQTGLIKQNLVKDATKLLFQLSRIDFIIEKTSLQIKNSIIEVKHKEEETLNGILDLSYLNNAIITLNKNKIAKKDLQLQKEDLINSFNNLSYKNYSKFDLPDFKLIEKSKFIRDNFYIKQARTNENTMKYLSRLHVSKYLPTISLTYNYTDDFVLNKNTSKSGFKISLPLSFGSYNDIQSGKIKYLQSKVKTKLIEKEEDNYINSIYNKVKIIDDKLSIQESNINYYEKLIIQMIDLKNGGLKTNDDVVVLQNSKLIESINLNIYKLDKQMLLLELYARTKIL